MQDPNKLSQAQRWIPAIRFGYWLFLCALLSFFVYARIQPLLNGSATGIDFLFFTLWVALLLGPLYSEISLFGISLKREIKELKFEVASQLNILRTEITTKIDFRNQFAPTLNFGAPPADSDLPKLKEEIRATLKEMGYDLSPISISPPESTKIAASQDVHFLFDVRYSIERELRRIWSDVHGELIDKPRGSIVRIVSTLADLGIVDLRLVEIVRELLSVCSPAIHGEDVTLAQLNFVRDVAPTVIDTLKHLGASRYNKAMDVTSDRDKVVPMR